MSKSSLPADLQPGDIVRFSRVVRVTVIDGDVVWGTDEKSGVLRRFITEGTTGRFELLHHRRPPTPSIGDVITGPELQRIRWKRGSVVRSVANDMSLMLDDAGIWLRSDGNRFAFSDFGQFRHYEVLVVRK